MKGKGIKVGILILIVIVAVVACVFLMRESDPLKMHLSSAVRYFNDGNYNESISEFDEAVKINNKIYNIYLSKANAEIAAEKKDAALESVSKMIDLLKISDVEEEESTEKKIKVLENMYNKSKCPGRDDMLFWFYENAYGNEKYSNYTSWVENHLPYSYENAMEKVRKNH